MFLFDKYIGIINYIYLLGLFISYKRKTDDLYLNKVKSSVY